MKNKTKNYLNCSIAVVMNANMLKFELLYIYFVLVDDPRSAYALHILNCRIDYGIAHAASDGTRRRTGGEVKGKDANGVGSQSSCIHTPHSSTASS